MTLSQRAKRMPASPIRKLVPYSDQAKARGVQVHHLNIGQPDIPTPKVMLEAYRSYSDEVLAYGPAPGLPELRQEVAHYYERYSLPLSPEEIFVTTGGSEALVFALASACDPLDEVIVFEPFYANYNGFARLLDINLCPIRSRIEDGFHLPSDEEIEARIGPKTRAILICSPGNPTGTIYTPEEMARLGRFADKHDLFLISDEVYREFAYGGAKVTSALSLGLDDQVIVVDSVSKRFSACGARVGFVSSKNRELHDAFTRFACARLCPATVDQLAAIAAYRLDPGYFSPIVEEYAARREVLVRGLRSLPGVQTYEPEGAFYTMAQFPVRDADDFCQWLLTSFDHEGRTVMMAPGSGFYATEGLGRTEARLAYVLQQSALEESVEILRAALESYPDRV